MNSFRSRGLHHGGFCHIRKQREGEEKWQNLHCKGKLRKSQDKLDVHLEQRLRTRIEVEVLSETSLMAGRVVENG